MLVPVLVLVPGIYEYLQWTLTRVFISIAAQPPQCHPAMRISVKMVHFGPDCFLWSSFTLAHLYLDTVLLN